MVILTKSQRSGWFPHGQVPALSLALLLGLGILVPQAAPGAGGLDTGATLMMDSMRKLMDAMGTARGSGRESLPALPWDLKDGARLQEQAAPAGLRVQGVWDGSGGERLVIKGGTFRLESGDGRQADGLVQARGGRLAFYSPKSRTSWVFAFAEDQGRLVLKDDQGQVFLFRRKELGTFRGDPPWW